MYNLLKKSYFVITMFFIFCLNSGFFIVSLGLMIILRENTDILSLHLFSHYNSKIYPDNISVCEKSILNLTTTEDIFKFYFRNFVIRFHF